MAGADYLRELAAVRAPELRGIYSVCSAHPWVLEAAMRRHRHAQGPLLIEATCNQVNQFGGYTGMRPGDFRDLVHRIAANVNFPTERILLGGDHLGPFPWQDLPAATAMENACNLVTLFVREGYTKIHLDASMQCADDPTPLPDAVIAQRAARLCAAAEAAAAGDAPVYVIGTEVPTPGGAVEEMDMVVTPPAAAEEALRLHREAFSAEDVGKAWDRVIALVVQPGVEFGHESVEDYDSERAQALSCLLQTHPNLVFEAHSTDYQQPEKLAALVQDGFAILKVGPGLTYAMRQAIFALVAIEDACVPLEQRSSLRQVVDAAMLADPRWWQKHYGGTADEQARLRVHSYSDRIRYYWGEESIQRALDTLISNLEAAGIPETLVSDYLPVQYMKLRAGTLENKPLELIFDAIGTALDPYVAACRV